MIKFGIGQAVPRTEDARLLTGRGRYTDDIRLDRQTYACFLRSPHAHAELRAIETARATAAPGVLAVFTGEDLETDYIGNLRCLVDLKQSDGTPLKTPPRPALALRRVRHVGEPVAMVVAETAEAARDAAELIEVDYDPLPAVVETRAALDPAAPGIWPEAPGNLCFEWQRGDRAATDAAFARAARVIALDLVNNRLVPNSMEGRAALGDIDKTGRMTLYVSSQGVHGLQKQLAEDIFHDKPERIRVVTTDVGGGFGMKLFLYPEYVMVLYAARWLQRPVKWAAERIESFLSDDHGRDNLSHVELALDRDGHFLALRVDTVANLGAYLSNFAPYIPTHAGTAMLAGVYTTPAIDVRVRGVFTNTAPVDAYRGAGRPESAYIVERTVDFAARRLGLDPAELRRRNFIPPSAMPFETALGSTYDSGDFARTLDTALAAGDAAGFPDRRAAAKLRGRLRGLGLASYIESCAGGGPELATLEVGGDGKVTVLIGTQSNGQGHETAYKQIVASRLGVAPDDITVVQGDTDRIRWGSGTGGSRSVPVGGASLAESVRKVIERATPKAAELLEAAAVDVEFRDGSFAIAGTDRTVSLRAVAAAAAPKGGGPAFSEESRWRPPANTYPNGTHLCEVEIDPETGGVKVVRYTVVDDFGVVINPALVAGQVHGGVVQGIGQALLESCVYDAESGQLVTASFTDYAMPRADHVPPIDFHLECVPCQTNALGMKGAGEAGAIGAPPAVINAVVDALAEFGVEHIDMPVTPEKLWRTIRDARAGR
ncbi:MAG: molybdopterin-dependent oxidoreductase [Azospirillum sp.]|nr:molybdopterin-dependent oxidoreductase [Azospirillum sp.]